ncbi:MAG: sugar transferase [Bacteroidales bacterium]|nr:sugar transferase [Bacteroidales bacterium]
MLKRGFDIVAAFFGLVLLIPLILLFAVLIKVRMPGKVFFVQERAGKNGKIFRLIKFRTMVENHSGTVITVKGDNRITPLGAWLRKYKLDELPELWNVLKGDMSFVGPRPDVPEYADKLKGEERLILTMRPGITGPATLKYADEEGILASVDDPVKYNDEVIFPDKVKINMDYLRTHSLPGDISLILKTVFRKY